MPQPEFDEMLRNTAVTLIDTQTFQQLMRGQDQRYIETLKRR